MMNKKGTLVLRDVVFMMMIASAIFVFAGLFVSEISYNYDNTNMTNEWAIKGTNTIANSTFYDTYDDMEDLGDDLSGNILSIVIGGLESMGNVIKMMVLAPNTIADLVVGTLEDMGLPSIIITPIRVFIIAIMWIIIIFTVWSAFTRGGKL